MTLSASLRTGSAHPSRTVALELLKQKYESTINPDYGYLVLVTNVKVDKIGKIIAGDGATYHKVKFEVFAFFPLKQEIIEGEVVEITDFGAFVRIGPTDAAAPPQSDNGRLPHQRREVGRHHRFPVEEDAQGRVEGEGEDNRRLARATGYRWARSE